jgi:hypothetical protein
MPQNDTNISPLRRRLLKAGLLLPGLSIPSAFGNLYPHPHAESLEFLDRNTYVSNMTLHTHFLSGQDRRGDACMMAVGNRRYLLQITGSGGQVYDITDPLHPVVVNDAAFDAECIELAFNQRTGKWLLVAGFDVDPGPPMTPDHPQGKYDDPSMASRYLEWEGLRGFRLYDATDPLNLKVLSEYSTDGGDPARRIQTGMGVKGSTYNGGRYLFLDTAPDNSFVRMESPLRYYSDCVQIVDLLDPEAPELVTNWWLPGQRRDEYEAYSQWRQYGDRQSFTGVYGGFHLPEMLENGGRYGYAAYGAFGLFVFDLADIRNPKLIGRFDPSPEPGAIPFHTVDVTRVPDHGLLLVNPEAINLDCNEAYHPLWIVDVGDPASPRPVGQLPRPVPPAAAPYGDFCSKRGRFGPHSPSPSNAPGRVPTGFTAYAFFIAGVQCFDISDPGDPRLSAHFIPPQAGSLDQVGSYHRSVDKIFVEWDRRIIWALTDTGIYGLSTPALGAPVLAALRPQRWALPGVNAGHP